MSAPPDVTPFLLIGAMKSGTTTLEALLRSHPDTDVTSEKEADSFFDEVLAAAAARRIRTSGVKAAGEVSTAYMQQPLRVPPVASVRRHLGPDVRLLAILRDPFDRAVSHWRHWTHLGRETAPVEVICADPDGPYVAFSSYHRQLEPWLSEFGPNQVHCMRLEDYQRDPVSATDQLWAFLDVRSAALGPIRENVGDERVAARGLVRQVSRSRVYRAAVRPLLPSRIRRRGLTTLGGTVHRPDRPPIDPALRAAFMATVTPDLCRLTGFRPHLVWDSAASEVD